MHDKFSLPAASTRYYTATRVITVEYSDSALRSDEASAVFNCVG